MLFRSLIAVGTPSSGGSSPPARSSASAPAAAAERALRGDGDEGAEPGVERLDPGQRVLDELGRAHLAGADGGGLLERGEVVQLGHGRRR